MPRSRNLSVSSSSKWLRRAYARACSNCRRCESPCACSGVEKADVAVSLVARLFLRFSHGRIAPNAGWSFSQQPADGRATRRGQVDARRAPAIDPAATVARRTSRGLDGRLGGGCDRRGRAHRPAAVPQPASFGQHARAGRWRAARQAGRDLAVASRCALSQGVRRIPAGRPRLPAPAAGIGRRHDVRASIASPIRRA